ncbi:MAG TPA: DUF6701 domain-containing protein [Burkholderiales bacterium]|nr:DUF6701 domain-containing protein [Burkholderiales bacterium]
MSIRGSALLHVVLAAGVALGVAHGPPVSAQIVFRAASSAAVPAVPGLRGVGTLANAASGAVTPGLPAGTAAGDFLLCVVESRDEVGHGMPAGWTQIAMNPFGSGHRSSLWRKIAVAGEVAPVVTHPGGSRILARIAGFTGVDPATPLIDVPTFTASGADQDTEGTGFNVTAPGVQFFTWVFTAHVAESYNNYVIGAGGPFYDIFESDHSSAAPRASIAAYYDVRPVGVQPDARQDRGPPSPRTAPSNGGMLALRPAAAGGLTIPTPAGTLAGDVMIASIAVRPSGTAITAPAGWTLVRQTVQANGDSNVLATYYRVAVAGEPADHTWTFAPAGISGAAGGILSFAGVDLGNPVDVEGGNTTPFGFVHAASGVTTTVPNTMLVSAHELSSSTTFTPPAGMTEAMDRASLPVPNSPGIALEMNYQAQAAAGASGVKSATAASTGTDASFGATHLLALRPFTGPDHYRVTHAAAGVNCQPESVTIVPHSATHAPVALNSATTITVTAQYVAGAGGPGNRGDWTLVSGGGTLNNGAGDDGVATYTFAPAGEATVVLALRDTWAQTVNIAVTDGAVTDTSGTASGDAGFNQDVAFSASGFRFVDALNNAVPNQVAGVTSGTLYLQAIESGACGGGACTGVCTAPSVFGAGSTVSIDLASECVNPLACQAGQQVSITNNGTTAIAANNAGSVSAYTPKSLLFGANGQAAFTLGYPDVGAIRLHARYTIPPGAGVMTGASTPFVVRPYSFQVSNVLRDSDAFPNPAAANAAGPAFIRAGDAFRATVTAVNFGGNPTPNYGKEAVPESARLLSTLAGGLGLTNNPALANATAFGPFNAGAASGTTFAWREAGIITLSAGVGDGDYLGAGDAPVFTQSGNVGRFIPHHFALSGPALVNRVAAACGVPSSFTYLGEGIGLGFTLTALDAAGTSTTQNYATGNGFAKLPTTPGTVAPASTLGYGAVSGITNLTGRLDTSVTNAITWAGGQAAVSATIAVSRVAIPDGPFTGLNIGIAPSDQDGVTLAASALNLDVDGIGGNDHALVGATETRFGRLRAFNAVGTQLSDLPVPLETQYYNGMGFITNGEDDCTRLAKNAVIFTNFQRDLAACETGSSNPPASLAFSRGKARLTLARPGPGAGADSNTGSVDLKPRLSSAEIGNTCVNGTPGAASDASQPWLQFQWSGSGAYDQNPTARASFGQARMSPEFIYFRENF